MYLQQLKNTFTKPRIIILYHRIRFYMLKILTSHVILKSSKPLYQFTISLQIYFLTRLKNNMPGISFNCTLIQIICNKKTSYLYQFYNKCHLVQSIFIEQQKYKLTVFQFVRELLKIFRFEILHVSFSITSYQMNILTNRTTTVTTKKLPKLKITQNHTKNTAIHNIQTCKMRCLQYADITRLKFKLLANCQI
eukprot:TRINITY_DN3981_c0_g1_i2.p1 TRINITY_DN3981_c0_g1~~TRINITY_DN3981_c0_g1_i2.p1  ORF type:complete len:193 (+),score=-23.83 TRINITY_DN3981_c0_g1_i2:275-853(+)